MKFYYISIFSLLLLGLIYLVGTALLVWLGLSLRKRWRRAWMVMVPLLILLYAAPVAEEFWIAWKFGRLCEKDAGIVVYKTVEVDGFYDSTMRSAYENTKPGRYRFAEHAREDHQGIERVERVNDLVRDQALAWYAQTNPGKERPRDRSIFYQLNDKETIAVFPNGIDAWRITKLEKPTARYQYKWTSMDVPVAHKVDKIERSVIDSELNEILARDTKYRRRAPWFFIGLDRPVLLCPEPGAHPLAKYGPIFNLSLKPKRND